MLNKVRLILLTLSLIIWVGWSDIPLWAQVPNSMTYSGQLLDAQGEPTRDGTRNMLFEIFDQPVGGTRLWGTPAAGIPVVVRKGQFSVLLEGFPTDLFMQASGNRYVQVTVVGESPMLPRQPLVSVPYAQRTASIDGARGGSISGNVGIGTGSPDTPLQVYGGSGNLLKLQSSTAMAVAGQVMRIPFVTNGNIEVSRIEANTERGTAIGLGFYTYNSGLSSSPNLYITSNGNVGIGTTVPSQKLEVYPYSDNTAVIGYAVVGNASGYGNHAAFSHVTQTGPTNYGFLQRSDGLTVVNSAQMVKFAISNSDKMVINSAGNVGIGTTSPRYKLDVVGTVHATEVRWDSDMRLKESITPLTGMLDKLDKIRGVSFKWNTQAEALGHSTGRQDVGVIAQEVETVFPELVTTGVSDNYKSVDYSRLTAVLIQAVKELKAETDQLKAENDRLKQRLQRLEDPK